MKRVKSGLLIVGFLILADVSLYVTIRAAVAHGVEDFVRSALENPPVEFITEEIVVTDA